MKKIGYIYWITTVLFCIPILSSGVLYLFNKPEITKTFNALGFPDFIIYPHGILKIIGASVLLTQKQTIIKEWAYAGIFFNLLLAIGAHINAQDGDEFLVIIILILMLVSYYSGKKYYHKKH